MKANQLIKKIRVYALISFLLPLITINSCMLFYKLLGHYDLYGSYNWNEKKSEYTLNEIALISNNPKSFTNCPEYKYRSYYTTTDNQTIEQIKTEIIFVPTITDPTVNSNLIKNLQVSNKKREQCCLSL